ncbi:MAG: hypothetical protein ACON5B_08835 [Myxococcota bacterium]
MSCPHEPTTLAWVYGEAPDAHAHHVGSCPICTQLVDDLEQVLALPASPPVARAVSRAPRMRPAMAFAAAAVAMLAAAPWFVPSRALTTPDPVPAPATTLADASAIDLELDRLEAALLDLELNNDPFLEI